MFGEDGGMSDRRAVALMYIRMYTEGMPLKYSIADARSNLPTIVDQAETGLTIELTRRGRPVAVVVSCREYERLRGQRPHFDEAYRSFLETYSLEEIGLEDDFAVSTRDKTVGRKVSF